MDGLSVYLPMDRRQALARGQTLPDYADGALLFADVSGFTPLAELLVQNLGPRRGIEELTLHLNQVYDHLVGQVHHYGGSVIGFSGDSISCWFADEPADPASPRAIACALTVQAALGDQPAPIQLKVAIAAGRTQRLLVGDPAIQQIELLVGMSLEAGNQLARRSETLVSKPTLQALGDLVVVREWRTAPDATCYGLVAGLRRPVAPRPWTNSLLAAADPQQLRPWLLPVVFERLVSGGGEFLTELRPATALFLAVDMQQPYSAGIDTDLLHRHVCWAQQVLQRYEGALIDVTLSEPGWQLYATFGAPITHEDDAERAVRAVDELFRPPAGLASRLVVRAGMSAGTMRTGAYGGSERRTYGVLGNDVILAYRLMQQAQPGEVLASEQLCQASCRGADWSAPVPRAIKGREAAVPVARLRRLRTQQVRPLLQAGDSQQLVGRQAELALLHERLTRAAAGQGGLVEIVGEAGIGKSRLVAELLREATRRGLTSYTGACLSYGVDSPFLPWQPIWQAFFGLATDDLPERQARRLAQALETLDPALRPRLPLLAGLIGVPLTGADFSHSLPPPLAAEARLTLLIDCLRARCAMIRPQPLLIVIEDIHWIDVASHELLLRVALASASLPLLLVVSRRPGDDAGQRPELPTALESHSVIRLTELSVAETTQLLHSRLDGPPALVDTLVTRAQGNPFFVEELLSYLQQQELTSPAMLDPPELPSSLHSLVLSRIDRLNPQQQTVLKVASVMGRQFSVTRLQGYYPELGAPDQLTMVLDELHALGLTPRDGGEPSSGYLFRHVITQEVAYQSMPQAIRAGLHERYAAYLEQLETAQPSQFDLLAYHYERGLSQAKAREYLWRAGESAAKRYANDAAVAYFGRALALTPELDLAARYKLLRAREFAYGSQARRVEQLADVVALEALAEQMGDDTIRLEVAQRRAEFAAATGDLDSALQVVRQITALSQQLGEREAEVRGYWLWGYVLYERADYLAAQQQLERSVQLARDVGLAEYEGRSLQLLGSAMADLAEFPAAIAYYEQAIAVARRIDNQQNLAFALNALGTVFDEQGEDDAAMDYYTQALTIMRLIGDRQGEAMVLDNMGNLSIMRGDYSQAHTFCMRGLELYRAANDLVGVAQVLTSVGRIAAARGQFTAAWRDYNEALELSQAGGFEMFEGQALGSISVLLGFQGDYAAALDYNRRALQVHSATGFRRGECIWQTHYLLLQHQLGNDMTVLEDGLEMLDVVREVGVLDEIGPALTVLGHLFSRLGRFAEASAAYHEAQQLHQQLCQPDRALEPLAGLARLALAEGRLVEAVELVQPLLLRLTPGQFIASLEPLRIELTCFQVLAAANDARASEILTMIYDTLQFVALHGLAPEQRELFLTAVPTNREICAAYAALPGRAHDDGAAACTQQP